MKRRHSMNSIVNRLADIESTAEAIVAHAEAQKPSIEREIQDKRDAFVQSWRQIHRQSFILFVVK